VSMIGTVASWVLCSCVKFTVSLSHFHHLFLENVLPA
jgi:hypothetical protein